MSKRNGKIDFLRLLFAIVIMLHHLGMRTKLFSICGLNFQVINAGGFVVAFFFLTSGWLLAKSADAVSKNSRFEYSNIPKLTTEYLWKRYKYFLTWFVPAFILNMVWDCMNCGMMEMLKHSFYNIPNLLMLQQIGFGNSDVYVNGYFVNASWYLSSLMLCSLIIYPLILWNREIFIRIIAPLITIIGLYVRLNQFGTLRGGVGLSYPMTVMCMGCMAYLISEYISGNVKTRRHICFLNCFENFAYIITLLYVCSSLPLSFEFSLIFLLFIAVSITFSNIAYRDYFDKPIFSFLGRASFPLYMLHEAIGLNYDKITGFLGVNHNSVLSHVLLYAICIGAALTVEYIYEKRGTSKE